jgi:hypothetical protein
VLVVSPCRLALRSTALYKSTMNQLVQVDCNPFSTLVCHSSFPRLESWHGNNTAYDTDGAVFGGGFGIPQGGEELVVAVAFVDCHRSSSRVTMTFYGQNVVADTTLAIDMTLNRLNLLYHCRVHEAPHIKRVIFCHSVDQFQASRASEWHSSNI